MKHALRALLLSLFAISFLVLPLLGRPMTEKDLFRFHWAGDPQVSPDGTQVAFVRVNVDEKHEGYQTAIWVVPVKGGGAARRMTNGPRDSAPRWSPDGRTLAFLRSVEKDGKPQPGQIFLLPLGGSEPRALTSMPKSVETFAWSPSGRVIAFTATTKPEDFDKDKKDGDKKDKATEGDDAHESDVRVINQAVYRFNGAGYEDATRTTHIWSIDVPETLGEEAPKPRQLTSGDYDEENLAWSPDGTRIYFASNPVFEPYYDVRDGALYFIPAAGGTPVKLFDAELSVGSYAPSPDGKWVAFAGEPTRPIQSHTETDLYVVSTTPGSQPKNLTGKQAGDILSGAGGDNAAPRGGRGPRPVWTSDGRIVVTTLREGMGNLARIDPATGTTQLWTSGKHTIQSFGSGGGATVAMVSTPTMIGDLFAVGTDGTLTRLTNVNEKLWSELTLSEPEEIWYTSFDGKKIEGWIQKPADFDPARKYPLILNIHGGPHTAYGYVFDQEFQWMAAKGYVVLYPNPRGSTSYGEEFANSIQFKYPGDDYKDLMAGVDAVVAKGYIDPKKLGVTGGSGGGLLTNWVVTQTDRFAAAVAQRDIADWSTFWYVADFTLFQPTWFHKAPFEDPEDYRARSPITYIDRVKTPMMFILGEADWRTPPMAGGEMMFRALKYRHIPTVMVRFPGESHELSRSGQPWHRVERLEHIVGWFDHYLMGVAKPEYFKRLRE
jgi:dipeptidyl aminopeptidase/acylaminoacyl peptidase